MPIPVFVWVAVELAASLAARAVVRQLAKEAAKKAAAEAAKKLAAAAARKTAASAGKKAVTTAARKAPAKAAPKATPKGNTAPKPHKGKKQKIGRCVLRPYSPDTCKPNTGHHVVPDRVFRVGARKGGARIPNSPTESEGLVICVAGKNLNPNEEHGQIHKKYDVIEAALGAKGTPPGTSTIIQLETLGAMSVGKIMGCNPAQLMAQLRAFHQSKGMNYDATVRADPYGKISQALDPKKLGSGPYGSATPGLGR